MQVLSLGSALSLIRKPGPLWRQTGGWRLLWHRKRCPHIFFQVPGSLQEL